MEQAHQDSRPTLWLIALCLLLSIHLNFENTGGTGLELPYNSFVLIFTSLILSSALWHLAKFKFWLQDSSLKFVGIILIAITLPVIFQESLEASQAGVRILGILTGLLLIILFFQCFQRESSWQQILLIMTAASSVEALLCLIQQYLPDIASYGVYKASYGRPFGSFQQPNVAASFITTGLAASLVLTLTRSIKERAIKEDKPYRFFGILFSSNLLLFITPLLSGIAIPLLGSRTGMLGCILVVLFCLPLIIQQLIRKTDNENTPHKRNILIWLASLIIGFSVGLTTLQFMESGGRSLEAIQSTNNRVGIYQQSFDMIQEKPLTGWGYGHFESNFLNYYAESYAVGDYSHIPVSNLDHPHNELLLWAVEGGLLPPLLLILLTLFLCYRILQRHGIAKALCLLALPIPLALHANTEYPFHQSFVHWLVFCLISAWLIWQGKNTNSNNTSTGFRWDFFARCFAIIIPVIIIPIMIINLQAIKQVTKYHATGKKNINHLSEVIHPSGIWKRFFFDVMAHRLTQGQASRNPKEVQSYILWAEEFLKHTPRVAIYFNLSNAYWMLGKHQQALATLQHTHYLYPHNQRVEEILSHSQNAYDAMQRQNPDIKKAVTP